jgi:hypothetical protein
MRSVLRVIVMLTIVWAASAPTPASAQLLDESAGAFDLLAFNERLIHCPYHPEHCQVFNITNQNYSVEAGIGFDVDGSDFPPPANVTAGGNATLVITLTKSGAAAAATHNVTVAVAPLPGLSWGGSTNQTVPLDATPVDVTFPFQVALVWPALDILLAPVSLGADDAWAHSFAPVRVLAVDVPEEESAARWLPGVGPMGVAVALLAVALLAARRGR